MAGSGLAQVKILMAPEFVRALDSLAEARGLNRSDYLRNLVVEDAIRQAAEAVDLTPEQWMLAAVASLEGGADAG